MRKYVTCAGDMFDKISYEQLGSCKYVEALINANRQHVGTYIFDAGTELIIPDVDDEKKTKKLPAWRQS